MSLKPSKIAEILEDIVRIPFYSIAGIVRGGKLLVYSNEGGFTGLFLVDPSSGERLRVTRESILWFAEPPPESHRVVWTRDVAGGKELQVLYYTDFTRISEDLLAAMEPLRIFGIADDGVNVAFTGATMEDVAVYIARRGSIEKIAKLPGFAFVNDVERDLVTGYGNLSGNPMSMEIFVLNISSGDLRVFTPRPGSVNKNPIIIGKSIVFESNAFSPKRNELLALDVETWNFKSLKFNYGDYDVHTPVEHVLYRFHEGIWIVVGKREGRTRLFLDGRLIQAPEGFINGAVYYRDKVYVSHASLKSPSKVLEIDPISGSTKVIIESRVPEYVVEAFANVGFEHVSSRDGIPIPVFYVESRHAGKPGPTIVYVHGGPWSEVADSWNTTIASLVVLGFNIVAPNFRGSTGYGESFRQLDIGDPGGGDLEDVAVASQWAWERGLADILYIMGGSYGGYMTLWALTNKPELYDCGVAIASVADWEEMYELSDAIFKLFIEVLFSENKELLKERSPISRIDNIRKPVCIIHPQNDTRTPLKPVLKMLNLMLDKGKSFEAHIIPDIGHVINTVDDAVKILLPAVLFLKRSLHRLYH